MYLLHNSPSSVVTINDKTEQFILNQCSTEVLLDVKASIEKVALLHMQLILNMFNSSPVILLRQVVCSCLCCRNYYIIESIHEDIHIQKFIAKVQDTTA